MHIYTDRRFYIMKHLVIAEKPSVARDIARVLGCGKKTNSYMEGKDYVVTWALGHLVTLADPEQYGEQYKTWNMDTLPMLPKHWKLVVIKQTSKQYHAVKEQISRKDISDIIIATDAGREGELVARWILDKAGNQKPLKRLWISSVTDKAIREGFAHLRPGKDYENLYHAAVARAESDWVVGINATPGADLQVQCSALLRQSPDSDPRHDRGAGRGDPEVQAADLLRIKGFRRKDHIYLGGQQNEFRTHL